MTDPELRALLDRLGYRDGDGDNNIGPVPRLPGAIDQVTDSVDVLTSPALWPRFASAVGLR